MDTKLENKELPLISVVIPMYNRESSIERCVNSVLSQSYSNIEVLVVDDASTDNSVAVANYIRDNRLRIIPSGKKVYAQGARNIGIKNARGEWVIFLDSDDELTNDSILYRYKILEIYPDADFIYGDAIIGKDNVVQFKNINNDTPDKIKKYIFRELCLCNFSVIMARKLCIEKINYLDEEYEAWQDDSIVLSFITKNFGLKHCGKAVVKLYASNNQIKKK
jgi:glycosyltransferase involved in cell wall biosynthesis